MTGDDERAAGAKQRKTPPARKLTDDGKRALRSAFNLSRTPTWAQIRDKHLPSLAVGLPPGSEIASKVCTENGLMAAVLGARLGVRDAFTPMAVCDALIAKALGMPAGKLSLDLIRAHVLAGGLNGHAQDAPKPNGKPYSVRLAKWIACSAVGATGTAKQRRMARAVARRWVCGEASPLGAGLVEAAAVAAPPEKVVAPSENPDVPAPPITVVHMPPPPPKVVTVAPPRTTELPAPPKSGRRTPAPPVGNTPVTIAGSPRRVAQTAPADDPPVQPPAPNLLEVVRETIPRVGAEGRFGEKVYVSAIWRTIERDHKAGDLSLDHFKRWLVRANRDGWLVLARADLIAAMDARQVNESEINDRGATFHFVLDQRNGAAVSQREHHAG
ncbi:MAG TPA: hypothetical protein VGD37_04205 [Kofleriaceae bacterium]